MNDDISSFPGAVAAILILAFVLTLPIGIFIISLYKKALIRGMSYSSLRFGQEKYIPKVQNSGTSQPIEIRVHDLASMSLPTSKIYSRINAQLRNHWFQYGLMSLVFAVVHAFCWLVGMNEFSFYRFLYATLLFSPVILPVSYLFLVRGRKQFVMLTVIFLVAYLLSFYLIMQQSMTEDISFIAFVTPLVLFNFPAIVLIGLLRMRFIKPVGLFIYSFFVICAAGPMLMIYALSIRPDIFEWVGYLFIDAGFSASNTLLIWHILSFAAMFILGWVIISRVRVLYVKKYINDLQLNADAMFIIFNIVYSLFISFGSITYALMSLLAFPICKLTGNLLFVLFRKDQAPGRAPRMLLLRVFALADDSRNLFERLLRHWRYGGSVQMISGPDLATSTVEPHELLSFVSGKLKESFCDSEDDILSKTQEFDNLPDLDSTYRVNEFFCRDNNWKIVVNQLIKKTDVVLMDLRSFSARFQGCRYEIETLVDTWNLEKTVFIVDHRTDLTYLQTTFEQAFRQMNTNSPNSAVQQISFYKTSEAYHRHVGRILQVLCTKLNTN